MQLLMEGYQPDWTTEFVTESGEVLRTHEGADGFVNESGEVYKWNSEAQGFLTESGDKKDIAITSIQGVFQRADVENANKRKYPRAVLEKVLSEKSDAMQRMRAGRMVGHMEHPGDGITDLNKVAIKISDLRMEKDGTVRGKADLLETVKGRDARALVKGGVSVGISSRGRGTVGRDGRVQNDFVLETFDLVHNPSTGPRMRLPRPSSIPSFLTCASIAMRSPKPGRKLPRPAKPR